MHKAIGHCRVSKGDAEEIKNSLNSQQTEIIKFASKLDITEKEIKWFIEKEARSAYSERSDWSILESAIEEACSNSDINYFLSFNQERFCRNIKKSRKYKQQLKDSNIQLRFASGDISDPDSESGFWQDGIQEMAAEAYSRKVGIDTLRGCKQNAITRDKDTGYALKNGGSAPFWLKPEKITIGINSYGENIEKTIWVENNTIHTAKFEGQLLSKTMWEWAKFYFIELRLNRKLGIEKARDILNELEIPAPRKKYWVATCLYEAERNESLIGIGTYNKRQFARNGKGKLKKREEWIIIENAHPALLSRKEFNELELLRSSKIKREGTNSKFQSNNEHILIGYPERFTCKSCESKIISSGRYYTCGIYNTNGKKGCGAPHFSVNSEWLENKIFEEIIKILNKDYIDKIYKDYITLYKTQDTSKEDLKETKKALEEKEKAQSNLIRALSSMQVMNETACTVITKELEKISKEIQELNDKITQLRKPKIVKTLTFEEFKNEVLTVKSLITRSNLHQKREIVWNFVNSIMLDPIERAVIIEFNETPICMFMENLKNPESEMEGANAPSMKLVAGARFELTTFGL